MLQRFLLLSALVANVVAADNSTDTSSTVRVSLPLYDPLVSPFISLRPPRGSSMCEYFIHEDASDLCHSSARYISKTWPAVIAIIAYAISATIHRWRESHILRTITFCSLVDLRYLIRLLQDTTEGKIHAGPHHRHGQ